MQHRISCAIVIAGLCATAGAQDERIIRFHADIAANADASLTVTETIRVYAAGNDIRRGIFREFPARYEVTKVLRDGVEDGYHFRGRSLYIGREDYFLPPGEYEYTITYRVPFEVRFSSEHDEVYWNVTGNAWAFAIEAASAAVHLPREVDAGALGAEAYTGPKGEKGGDWTAEIQSGGTALYRTTRALGPGEGLTIVLTFPKGVITKPSLGDALAHMATRNTSNAIVFAGIFASILYLVIVWAAVGRDPAAGQIRVESARRRASRRRRHDSSRGWGLITRPSRRPS